MELVIPTKVMDRLDRSNAAWRDLLSSMHQVDEALMGMILGLVYLVSRRNLTSVIVAHGISDTVDAFLFFIGHYPGT